MIRVEVGNQKYAFSFKHEIFKEIVDGKVVFAPRPINGRFMKGKTTCWIYSGDPKNSYEFSKGVSYCSEMDNFNKDVGRKVSLTRALEGFDRDIREAFWAAYHGRKD